MEKTDEKKVDGEERDDAPRILESEEADRGDRPNTCRSCGGSKFC